jgi:hypothetical protein
MSSALFVRRLLPRFHPHSFEPFVAPVHVEVRPARRCNLTLEVEVPSPLPPPIFRSRQDGAAFGSC